MDQLKNFISLLLSLIEIIPAVVSKDWKTVIADGFDAIKNLGAASFANLALALQQYRGLTDDTAEQLKQFVSDEFKVDNAKLQAVVDGIFDVAISLHGLLQALSGDKLASKPCNGVALPEKACEGVPVEIAVQK